MRDRAEQAPGRRARDEGVRLHRSGRVHTAAVPFPAGSGRPESWLAVAPVSHRGAWIGRDGWAAYGGDALRLTAPPEDRFRILPERVEEALGSADPTADDGPTPRLYGGFSYDGDGSALWDGFPGACFVLPRWEIRHAGPGSGGGPLLLLHWLDDEPGPGAGGPGGPDPDGTALSLRARLLEATPRSPAGAGHDRGSGPAGRRARGGAGAAPEPDEGRERWLDAVGAALAAIRSGKLRKVVLARSLEVEDGAGPLEALANLRSRPTGPGTFLVQPGADSAFLGSSPELLAELRGTRFAATAVAGSAERGTSPEEDRARARALAESGKDRREQAIVADDILERLSTLATAVRVSDPTVLELPEIFHLESRVEARLPGRLHVLEVLDRIHPTPAVCGRPRDRANAFLRRHEALARGWYAGPVGWFDLRGDGSFSPGLRSGLWTGTGWRLFAGAGIVEGSRPDREWEETELKLQAIRRGFGLAGA